jgi:NACalpha-BTF3-like transcription factor
MKEVPKSAAEKEITVPQYNKDDLRLVIDQTGVNREKAI